MARFYILVFKFHDAKLIHKYRIYTIVPSLAKLLGKYVGKQLLDINKFPQLKVGFRRYRKQMIKGQLISKGLFVLSILPKKRTKNFCLSRLGQKLTFSSLFFGRIEDTKISF
jgi:hypothetical protein